jgi:hypothetical protein
MESRSLPQFVPVRSVLKTKLSLLDGKLMSAFDSSISIAGLTVTVVDAGFSLPDLWQASSRIGNQSKIVTLLSDRMYTEVICGVLEAKALNACQSSEYAWSTSVSPSLSENISSVCETLVSIFTFLRDIIRAPSDLNRRIWGRTVPDLIARFGHCANLAGLESRLVDDNLVPSDVSRRLSGGWDQKQKESEQSKLASLLNEVRQSLLNDPNRISVRLTGVPSKLIKTYVPSTVTVEATKIVSKYMSEDESVLERIIALFIALRQPETCDPKAIDARQAGLFYNDCIYICLGLILSKRTDRTLINLLRSTAAKSISWFIENTAIRAVGYLKLTEKDIDQSLREIDECLKQWTLLHVSKDILDLWSLTLVDPLIKALTRQCVEAGRSNKANGIWSVYRYFVCKVEARVPIDFLKSLVSWTVALRVRIALTGGQSDVDVLEPLPDDELLYEVSRDDFEVLLASNPILHGEPKESIKRMARKFMMKQSGDVSVSPPRKIEQPAAGERTFASLFDRH